MSNENLFEVASRKAFRFDSKAGLLTVEQLWVIPLTSATKANLDEIAIRLHDETKSVSQSFVTPTRADKDLTDKLEIVKYIISVRMTEAQAKVDAQNIKEQRARINELIQRKEDDKLASLSVKELKELASKLS